MIKIISSKQVVTTEVLDHSIMDSSEILKMIVKNVREQVDIAAGGITLDRVEIFIEARAEYDDGESNEDHG